MRRHLAQRMPDPAKIAQGCCRGTAARGHTTVLTVSLQDSEYLVPRHALDLGDAVRVTQHHTDLGRRQAFLGQLADLFADIRTLPLQPAGRCSAVRDCGGRHTLPVAHAWRCEPKAGCMSRGGALA